VRRFWKGDGGVSSELATRLCGSSDLYERSGRRPYASINFVTCHDGFTLHDLVSYNDRHNKANGEENRDGTDNNLSWNLGAEGPTQDPEITELRERQKRNFLAFLLLSQGVPMICGGDEIGRSQRGNNNAYCQDNEVSWLDWNLDERRLALLEFTRRMTAFRAKHPSLHRRRFFQDRQIRGTVQKEVVWLRPDGAEMTDEEWQSDAARALAIRLSGEFLDLVDESGQPLTDDTLLILLNAHPEAVTFSLPARPPEAAWELVFDTATVGAERKSRAAGETYELGGRALAVLRLEKSERRE
jgi:isoamylase